MREIRVEEQAEGVGSRDFRPVGGAHAVVGPGNTTAHLGIVPGGALIFDVRALVRTPFNGTAVISIGDSLNPTRFLSSAPPHSIACSKDAVGYEVPHGGADIVATFTGSSTTGVASVALIWLGRDSW